MYRLMLVEDEKLVRESMIESTDWTRLGYEVVCACADGQEAIEQLNQVMPDVIITDICMPLVDGIELAGYVRQYFPQVLVVMLTGHGEFEYAQSALKLHVFDYVLKPILPKAFDQMLLQIGQELDRRRQENERAGFGKNSSWEMICREIFRGHGERLEPAMAEPAACVMLVTQAAASSMEPRERMGQLRRISDCIMTMELPCETAIVDHYCIMLVVGGETTEQAEVQSLLLAQRILKKTAAVAPVCIGIGDAVTESRQLHGSSNQALHALGYGYSLGASVLTDRQMRELEWPISYKQLREYETAVTKAMAWKDHKGARDAVLAWSNAMTTYRVHQDQALASLKRLETSIRDQLGEDLWQEVSRDDLQQTQQELLDRIDHAAASSNGGQKQVERAESYIRMRYMDYEFSLSEVLDYLGVSKSYFCPLFRAKTGRTFTEYLAELRMEEAKALLRNTNLYTSEIAARVGYLDANYFSMTFKRMVGVTPKQYRKEQ